MWKRLLTRLVCAITLFGLVAQQPFWLDGSTRTPVSHSRTTKCSKAYPSGTSLFEESEDADDDAEKQLSIAQTPAIVLLPFVTSNYSPALSILETDDSPYSLQNRPRWLVHRKLIL